jgi:predicted metal-dependent hydrolase
VLDYVIWHEVCHLEMMDHSPRFWALVARRCPEHREHAAWLKRNAATLVI